MLSLGEKVAFERPHAGGKDNNEFQKFKEGGAEEVEGNFNSHEWLALRACMASQGLQLKAQLDQ